MGKGTYASNLAMQLHIPHISTGELLRREVKAGTSLGCEISLYVSRGLLVPDDIVNKILFERLAQPDCKQGFILDGYPRTISQALTLEERYPLDVAVLLHAPLEVVVERVSGRLYCPVCGKVYHERWKPPARRGYCDVCGTQLVRREDDSEEIVRHRYEEYMKTISPVVEFYKEREKLLFFDASRDASIGIPILLEELRSFLTHEETAVIS